MANQQMQVANKAPTALREFLCTDNVRNRLAEVARGFMTPEEMVRFALLASAKNSQIGQCSPESILRCLMDAAAVKIKPGGYNGRGWIVPRRIQGRWEAFFDPGYRGLMDIARRSGTIGRIAANPVYEKDEFEYSFTPFPELHHVPYRGSDRGKVVAAYAAAEIKDTEGFQLAVLEAADLDKIAAMSPAGDNGPWGKWDGEMSMKSAVRRLAKLLAVEDQDTMDRAMQMIDRADGVDYDAALPSKEGVPKTQALADKIRGKKAPDSAPDLPVDQAAQTEPAPPAEGPRQARRARGAAVPDPIDPADATPPGPPDDWRSEADDGVAANG